MSVMKQDDLIILQQTQAVLFGFVNLLKEDFVQPHIFYNAL